MLVLSKELREVIIKVIVNAVHRQYSYGEIAQLLQTLEALKEVKENNE